MSETHQEGQGLGLPPAPNVEPAFATAWLGVKHPESVSAATAVLMARQEFIAGQNQQIMGMIQNLYTLMPNRRGSVSSTAASTAGDDDTGLEGSLSLPAGDIQEAYDGITSGELHDIMIAIHDPFVTVNNKELYVQRTMAAAKDAQTFIKHGQEADVHDNHVKILGYIKNLTPDLINDVYIGLNKAKRDRDKPQDDGKKTAKGKAKFEWLEGIRYSQYEPVTTPIPHETLPGVVRAPGPSLIAPRPGVKLVSFEEAMRNPQPIPERFNGLIKRVPFDQREKFTIPEHFKGLIKSTTIKFPTIDPPKKD
ncbi:hypothetical protein FALBO_8103 [Fusarium albosuccineum]|uniref:Uncharacterized protein n=1 Tax=Fusarium albosuccineum TaxID=1237068 RepID=A0A8H4LBS5_9HYPO|nr:hypothetical protein FALBO_8103 [Fusarium albosuccineum]